MQGNLSFNSIAWVNGYQETDDVPGIYIGRDSKGNPLCVKVANIDLLRRFALNGIELVRSPAPTRHSNHSLLRTITHFFKSKTAQKGKVPDRLFLREELSWDSQVVAAIVCQLEDPKQLGSFKRKISLLQPGILHSARQTRTYSA